MRTSSLVWIALRFYAIYWFIQSLSELAEFAPWFLAMPEMDAKYWSVIVAPAVMLVFSIGLWFWATRISSIVVRGHDAELRTVTLSREGSLLLRLRFSRALFRPKFR